MRGLPISHLTRGKAKTDHDQCNEKDANQRVECEIDYPVQALVKSEPDKDQNQDYRNKGEGDDGEMRHYGSSRSKGTRTLVACREVSGVLPRYATALVTRRQEYGKSGGGWTRFWSNINNYQRHVA